MNILVIMWQSLSNVKRGQRLNEILIIPATPKIELQTQLCRWTMAPCPPPYGRKAVFILMISVSDVLWKQREIRM